MLEKEREIEGIEHKMISVNGINMHVAKKRQRTSGPLPSRLLAALVLMAAPDPLHGNARLQSSGAGPPRLRHTTGAPVNDSTKFTILHVIGDNVGLPNKIAPDEDKVFVVGHDWGAYAAWYLCLYRPDRVKALVNLSIHYVPRNPTMKPIKMFRFLHGDDHYICRFQVLGDIEAEFAQIGVRRVDLKKMLISMLANFRRMASPEELTTTELLICENWELTAPWTGSQVKVPVKFIVGDLDLVYNIRGAKEYINNGGFKKDVPLLDEVVVMEGVAHFLNQEKPEEINKHILEFIKKF
ncbi:unnamed protein product [Camellia sinensis]